MGMNLMVSTVMHRSDSEVVCMESIFLLFLLLLLLLLL